MGLLINFIGYWSVVAYCAYAFRNHIAEGVDGAKSLPPLEVSLLGLMTLSTQSTLEFAAVACLTQPARAKDPHISGLRVWDCVAWVVGLGARATIMLDALCLPLVW